MAATTREISQFRRLLHTLTLVTASIGEMAFSECNQLHSITIPEPVKSIGNSAFQNCTGLEYIQIPSTVTVIGSFSSPAFYGCSALKSIEVNASNQNFSSENGILFNKDKSILILVTIRPAFQAHILSLPQ